MQFLPDIQNSTGTLTDFFSVKADLLNSGTNFDEIFQGYQSYNDDNNVGIPSGFRSVKDDDGAITSDSLSEFERSLREQGVNENAAQALMQELNNLSSMPTLGQLMGVIRNVGSKEITLTEDENNTFNATMTRLGFNKENISDLQNMVANGKGLKALKSIENAMEEGMFTLSKEEAAALAKALGLSTDAQNKIMGLFGENEDMSFNQAGFSKLFGAGLSELTAESAELSKIRSATMQAINDMLEQNKLNANQISNSNRTDKNTRYSEVIMREGMTSEDEEGEGYILRRGSIAGNLLKENVNAKADINENVAERRDGNFSGRQRFLETNDDVQEDRTGSNNQNEAKNGKHSSTLLENAAKTVKNDFATRVDFAAGATTPSYNEATPNQGTARTAQYFTNSKVFEQLESSIMRQAANGGKQMVMQLNQSELGRLTVDITVANGEVKAILTTEKPEATALISEQLAELKANLEEQGLKVASIEVETSADNNLSQNLWSSEQEHNKQQELMEQARFIRLSKMRASEGEALARNVQQGNHTAIIAEAGLHLIA